MPVLTKDHRGMKLNMPYPEDLNTPYRRYIKMTKVIKEEFEKIKDVKDEDVSLTCDSPLEVFNNEVNRLNGMDDDLFTYESWKFAKNPIGDDEVELTDEEFSDNEDEVAKVFRIDTNIFDFETP
ncbi:hypothetical protein Tco_1250512, partial [Tanacetum coccineum]